MKLEILDLQTSKPILVDSEGMTFGREGGDAQIRLKDMGVSKRHARVFQRKGAWFIEDMNSSNGTYVDQQRIRGPVQLNTGAVFSLSQQQFEVLQEVEEGAESDDQLPEERAAANGRARKGNGVGEPSKSKKAPSGARGKAAPPTVADQRAYAAEEEERPAAEDEAPPEDEAHEDEGQEHEQEEGGEEEEAEDRSSSKARGGARREHSGQLSVQQAKDEFKSKGVGYFFIAVPKAIAYYLVAVPLMLINPIGTIRKGIEQQKHEAMGPMELIAYALPATVISALVPSILSGIVMLIQGHFSLMALIPIVPLISAVVGAVISGFIFHPLLSWIVKILKGKSDARSRSNMFMMQMTATILLTLPGAIAVLSGIITPHFRFFTIIPLALSLLSTAISLFILYSWFAHWNVVKWFKFVCLGLFALSALGTVSSLIAIIRAPSASADADTAAAIAAAGALAGQNGNVEEAVKAAQEKSAKEIKARSEETKAMAEKAQAAVVKGGAATAAAAEARVAEAKADVAAAVPAVKGGSDEADEKGAETAAATEKAVEKGSAAALPTGGAMGGFREFAQRRAAVEKAISENPLLLKKPAVLQLYRRYSNEVHDIESDYQRATSRRPGEAKVNAYLKEADIFEKTQKTVNELYEKLQN